MHTSNTANRANGVANSIDGWMTCDFTSFSTVFQSYQDDGSMIMKGCVQWNPVYGGKSSPQLLSF